MTVRQDPLVSVVTPVHNGERYLRECIESVLAQTYTHWDYTIVDNCSTDGTLDIARAYAARDARIRIHENDTFVRVNESHNIALRQVSAASKYCKVVAADDWLFSDCLAKMVALAEAHPSVAIVGAYGLAGDKVVWVGLPYRENPVIARGREACRMRLLGGPYVFGTPTSVLLRSDIVRGRAAFYNESNLHADSEACFELLGDHDFGFVHQVLTFRRDQEDSVTARSQQLNTYLPGVLEELLKYGRKYLSDEECRQRVKEHLQEYYRFLGHQVYKRRGREFWSFHRDKLAGLGYPLRTHRLALAALSYALDLTLNPKSTAAKAVGRLRGSFTRNGSKARGGD
jgi:glycosyltransferase involved in cell wall biosynthesis